MARFHRGFPDLAFLLLAVSHDAEDIVILLVQLRGQRDAYGYAQTLAERSGGDFNAWQLQPVRMPLIGRIKLAQEHYIFFRTESGEGQAERVRPARPHRRLESVPPACPDPAAQRAARS